MARKKKKKGPLIMIMNSILTRPNKELEEKIKGKGNIMTNQFWL